LLEAIRDHVHLVSAESLHITASVGVAELEAGTTAAAALAAADLAMYEAKRTGRDHVVVFTRELNAGADSVRSWAEEIRSALDRDRFQLYFQPIVDLRTGAVAQYELLLCLRGERDDLVAPARSWPSPSGSTSSRRSTSRGREGCPADRRPPQGGHAAPRGGEPLGELDRRPDPDTLSPKGART
jgi:hypothetical protein